VSLAREWATLLARVGAAGDVAATGERLLARWREPHRRYHNLDHLSAVLRRIDDLASHAADPDAVRLAAWYHDAVYRGSGTDEHASAALAADELAARRLDATVVAEVVRLVELTATHDPPPGDRNGEVLCDADLAVLASAAEEYDAYAAAVRAEYRHVADAAFAAARVHLLRSLLSRPTLFRTPYGLRRWEVSARANLRRELASRPPLGCATDATRQGSVAMPEVSQDVRDFLEQSHPELVDLALWVRAVVLEAEPDLTERVYRGWDGVGFRHPDAGYVCAIYPRGEAIHLLFEHGARLPDPDHLFEGQGTQTRFVRVTAPDDDLARSISSYVRGAVADRLFRR
jgi:predicted metal-dependent HD superfamily phosphohydrolase